MEVTKNSKKEKNYAETLKMTAIGTGFLCSLLALGVLDTRMSNAANNDKSVQTSRATITKFIRQNSDPKQINASKEEEKELVKIAGNTADARLPLAIGMVGVTVFVWGIIPPAINIKKKE